MRAVLFLGLMFCLGGLNAQPGPEEKAVRKTIKVFFDAFHSRDPGQLKAVAGPGCIVKSISENEEGKIIVSTRSFNGFVKTITGLPRKVDFEEKLLSLDIRHDGLMAHVWAPYEFYFDHKLQHTGVNSFVLFRNEKGAWKIIGITDTRKKNVSR